MPSEPKPQVIAVPGLSILLTAGRWTIETDWPRITSNAIEANVTRITDANVGGYGTIAREVRMNFRSVSAREVLLRLVEKDDKPELRNFLGTISATMAHQIHDTDRPQLMNTTEPQEVPGWILRPFWPASGSVGLAAAPGSYKSFLGLGAALQIATGRDVLKSNTRTAITGTVMYLDWEDTPQAFARRLRALERGAGIEHGQNNIVYYRPARSLSAILAKLQKEIAAVEPVAVVVDSMSAAIDGSMNDSEIVNEFWNAVHYLDRPTMVITHKSLENQQKRRAAFQGSGMSLARVRMAWNAEKSDEGPVVWSCFKDNHGPHEGSRLAWDVQFHNDDDDEDQLEAVTIDGMDPSKVRLVDDEPTEAEAGDSRQAIYNEICGALDEAGTAGMLFAQLIREIHMPEKTVRNRIGELIKDGRVATRKDGRKSRYWFARHYRGTQESMPEGAENDPY